MTSFTSIQCSALLLLPLPSLHHVAVLTSLLRRNLCHAYESTGTLPLTVTSSAQPNSTKLACFPLVFSITPPHMPNFVDKADLLIIGLTGRIPLYSMEVAASPSKMPMCISCNLIVESSSKIACILHCCKNTDCDCARCYDGDYCEKHTCALDGCNRNRIPCKGYCAKHQCRAQGCSSPTFEYEGLQFCAMHRCELPTCPRQNLEWDPLCAHHHRYKSNGTSRLHLRTLIVCADFGSSRSSLHTETPTEGESHSRVELPLKVSRRQLCCGQKPLRIANTNAVLRRMARHSSRFLGSLIIRAIALSMICPDRVHF